MPCRCCETTRWGVHLASLPCRDGTKLRIALKFAMECLCRTCDEVLEVCTLKFLHLSSSQWAESYQCFNHLKIIILLFENPFDCNIENIVHLILIAKNSSASWGFNFGLKGTVWFELNFVLSIVPRHHRCIMFCLPIYNCNLMTKCALASINLRWNVE